MVETEDVPTMILVEEGKYNELLEMERWVYALEAAGVDNWEGYGFAQDVFEENE